MNTEEVGCRYHEEGRCSYDEECKHKTYAVDEVLPKKCPECQSGIHKSKILGESCYHMWCNSNSCNWEDVLTIPFCACALCHDLKAENAELKAVVDAGHVSVAGSLRGTIANLEHRAKLYIEEEQKKLAPDNGLIAVLCDAVRLGREYSAEMNKSLSSLEKEGRRDERNCSNCQGRPAHCTKVEVEACGPERKHWKPGK